MKLSKRSRFRQLELAFIAKKTVQKISLQRGFFWLDLEVFSQELNGRSSPLSALERWSFAQPAAGAVGEEGLPGVAAAVGSGEELAGEGAGAHPSAAVVRLQKEPADAL